jgi:hypothetical protein
MADAENERMGIISATSMLRTVGKLGGPSGRGLIMFRTLAVASTSAAIVGICGAFAGGTSSRRRFNAFSDASIIGLLGSGGGHFFVIGSCIGYVTSALYFYRNQIRQAFLAFDDYPELIKIHLIMQFPVCACFFLIHKECGCILRSAPQSCAVPHQEATNTFKERSSWLSVTVLTVSSS